MRSTTLAASTCLTLALGALLSVSAASAAEHCHTINARGTGSLTSPTTTVARIVGAGLLTGTTTGTFTPTSPTTFTGPVEFTTSQGTVTISLDGSFPTPTSFTGEGDITASTGRLGGATGHLRFDGDIIDASGAFTETLRGQLCVDLAR